MLTTRIEISAQTVFNLLNGYPNPKEDSPRGPFDPIGPVSNVLRGLIAAYIKRPVSDPPGWDNPYFHLKLNVSIPTHRILDYLTDDPWPYNGPDDGPGLPWRLLASLAAFDHASQFLELDSLVQYLPEASEGLYSKSDRLAETAMEGCGTMTPSQRFINLLKKKKIPVPPGGCWPGPIGPIDRLLMSNAFYQVSLQINDEKIAGIAESVASKLLAEISV